MPKNTEAFPQSSGNQGNGETQQSSHEKQQPPKKRDILAGEFVRKELIDKFGDKFTPEQINELLENDKSVKSKVEALSGRIQDIVNEANANGLQGKQRSEFISSSMTSELDNFDISDLGSKFEANESEPQKTREDYPSTKELEAVNEEPVRYNILKRAWMGMAQTWREAGGNPFGTVVRLAKKGMDNLRARRENETDEAYEKRMKRRKVVLAIGGVALTGAVAYGVYRNALDNSSEVMNASIDASGDPGAGSENILDFMGDASYGNMFDGYDSSEDIFKMAGKLGEHDWRAPLEGGDAAARGSDFLDGLQSSPGELSVTLDELGLLPEDMTREQAQEIMSSDPARAMELAKALEGGKIEFKQGAELGAGDVYSSFYGVEMPDGSVQMAYDNHVTGEPSGVVEMHFTDKDGNSRMIEIREACGQIIERAQAEAPINNYQPVGGGGEAHFQTAQGGGTETVINTPYTPPQGGGTPETPVNPPTGGGEVPPNPTTPETPTTPTPNTPETPITPTPETPSTDLAPKSENPDDYVHIADAPLAEAGAVEQPAQTSTPTEVITQTPGSAIAPEQIGGQAAGAVVDTVDVNRVDAGVGDQGAEAAAVDLTQSYDSAVAESTVEQGATTEQAPGGDTTNPF